MPAKVKPVLSYDVDMGGDTWVDAGGYALWTRTIGPGEMPLQLLKHDESGATPLAGSGYALHNIRGGLAHRLAHGFGFWRISDGDAIFLKTTEGDRTHYTFALTTGAPNYEGDAIAWYCPNCNRELARRRFETRRFGVSAFWTWALEEARRFNGTIASRTCRACAAVHPAAYGLMPADDEEHEREARALW